MTLKIKALHPSATSVTVTTLTWHNSTFCDSTVRTPVQNWTPHKHISTHNHCKLHYYITTYNQIQINQPTKCNNFSSLLLDIYLQLNMFRASSRPSSWSGRPRLDHDQQHCYHHVPKVKPEAATAVVELLMMGVRTPETC